MKVLVSGVWTSNIGVVDLRQRSTNNIRSLKHLSLVWEFSRITWCASRWLPLQSIGRLKWFEISLNEKCLSNLIEDASATWSAMNARSKQKVDTRVLRSLWSILRAESCQYGARFGFYFDKNGHFALNTIIFAFKVTLNEKLQFWNHDWSFHSSLI